MKSKLIAAFIAALIPTQGFAQQPPRKPTEQELMIANLEAQRGQAQTQLAQMAARAQLRIDELEDRVAELTKKCGEACVKPKP